MPTSAVSHVVSRQRGPDVGGPHVAAGLGSGDGRHHQARQAARPNLMRYDSSTSMTPVGPATSVVFLGVSTGTDDVVPQRVGNQDNPRGRLPAGPRGQFIGKADVCRRSATQVPEQANPRPTARAVGAPASRAESAFGAVPVSDRLRDSEPLLAMAPTRFWRPVIEGERRLGICSLRAPKAQRQ